MKTTRRLLKIRPERGDPPDEAKDQSPETPEEQQALDEEERQEDAPNLNDEDEPEE